MERIIILTYDYSPNNGGIARLCKEIVKQCIFTRTDYLVVTNIDGPAEKNVERIVISFGSLEIGPLKMFNCRRMRSWLS